MGRDNIVEEALFPVDNKTITAGGNDALSFDGTCNRSSSAGEKQGYTDTSLQKSPSRQIAVTPFPVSTFAHQVIFPLLII
ncbi:MAG: hypothetical protein AAGH38_05810 [Pseudomonadota bacterium]